MSHPRSEPSNKRGRNALRLAALGWVSLTLMACGNVAQTPDGSGGQARTDVQAQLLPCPESSAPESGTPVNLVTCDPPDPGPAPDPTPTPPAPTQPTVTPEMADALRQEGLAADPSTVGQTFTRSCDVALYTQGRDTQVCTLTGLKDSSVRSDGPNYKAVRINIPSQHNCSWTQTELAQGGSVQSRTEIDNIYGRAIDAALRVGNVNLAAQLGQMRAYHLSVINLSSDSPIVQITFTAFMDHSFLWAPGKGGHCNGTVSADFVWR